jgi:hypothetical protein
MPMIGISRCSRTADISAHCLVVGWVAATVSTDMNSSAIGATRAVTSAVTLATGGPVRNE